MGESLQIFWCVYKITQKLANKIIDKIYRYVNLEHALLTKRKSIMYTKYASTFSHESGSHKCGIRFHVKGWIHASDTYNTTSLTEALSSNLVYLLFDCLIETPIEIFC